MSTSNDHSWMRFALDAMFELPQERAVEALRSDDAFEQYRRDLEAQDSVQTGPIEIESGERGDNLMKALLALRIKFPREVAAAKLEVNIAMRTRR